MARSAGPELIEDLVLREASWHRPADDTVEQHVDGVAKEQRAGHREGCRQDHERNDDRQPRPLRAQTADEPGQSLSFLHAATSSPSWDSAISWYVAQVTSSSS